MTNNRPLELKRALSVKNYFWKRLKILQVLFLEISNFSIFSLLFDLFDFLDTTSFVELQIVYEILGIFLQVGFLTELCLFMYSCQSAYECHFLFVFLKPCLKFIGNCASSKDFFLFWLSGVLVEMAFMPFPCNGHKLCCVYLP